MGFLLRKLISHIKQPTNIYSFQTKFVAMPIHVQYIKMSSIACRQPADDPQGSLLAGGYQ